MLLNTPAHYVTVLEAVNLTATKQWKNSSILFSLPLFLVLHFIGFCDGEGGGMQ